MGYVIHSYCKYVISSIERMRDQKQEKATQSLFGCSKEEEKNIKDYDDLLFEKFCHLEDLIDKEEKDCIPK